MKNKKLANEFAVSFAAVKWDVLHGVTVGNGVVILKQQSKGQAEDLAMRGAKCKFPVEEGWGKHNVFALAL